MVKLSENTLVTIKLSLLVSMAVSLGWTAWHARGAYDAFKRIEVQIIEASDSRWRSYEETYKTAEDTRRMNSLFKEHFPEQYAKMRKDPQTNLVEMFIRPEEVKKFFLQLEKNENGN